MYVHVHSWFLELKIIGDWEGATPNTMQETCFYLPIDLFASGLKCI